MPFPHIPKRVCVTEHLAEVLCITGMRIAEALSLNRAQIDWETQTAQIVGKGNKPRKVYFTDSALAWIRQYLDIRHDDHPALFVTQGENSNTTKSPRHLETLSSLCQSRLGSASELTPICFARSDHGI